MDDLRFADMISKIAHELRSPLTSVKGFSATLIGRWDRFTDEQKLELTQAIHHDAERMGRIVSEVLDLARAESGRLELTKTVVSIADIIERAADMMKAHPGFSRIQVEVDPGMEASLDKERMLHVFGNLIENAVKFSDEGPILVKASDGPEEVTISVRDEGVGIELERVDQVFSGPAPHGGKATPSGTGLGLYLSKKIVDAHGGEISVMSEEGKGSTLTVRLPREAG